MRSETCTNEKNRFDNIVSNIFLCNIFFLSHFSVHANDGRNRTLLAQPQPQPPAQGQAPLVSLSSQAPRAVIKIVNLHRFNLAKSKTVTRSNIDRDLFIITDNYTRLIILWIHLNALRLVFTV